MAKPGRLFVAVDVTFLDEHRGLSDGAVRLWLEGASWAKSYLSDGRVPAELIRNRKRLATELVKAGLWNLEPDGGYRITAWLEWNPSASVVRARRKAERDRKRRVRAESGRDTGRTP